MLVGLSVHSLQSLPEILLEVDVPLEEVPLEEELVLRQELLRPGLDVALEQPDLQYARGVVVVHLGYHQGAGQGVDQLELSQSPVSHDGRPVVDEEGVEGQPVAALLAERPVVNVGVDHLVLPLGVVRVQMEHPLGELRREPLGEVDQPQGLIDALQSAQPALLEYRQVLVRKAQQLQGFLVIVHIIKYKN